VSSAGSLGHGIIATIVSFAVLSLDATGVFSELYFAIVSVVSERCWNTGPCRRRAPSSDLSILAVGASMDIWTGFLQHLTAVSASKRRCSASMPF
jgi:hypothetical protein